MHETIEGEVIVIDLETGSYYSLRETSAEIWQGIESGADENEIVDSLHLRYDASPETIGAAVGELLDQLAAESLIEPGDGSSGVTRAAPVHEANGRVPFPTPTLEKHTDMQDLILLDPVHKVGPRGWPHPAESEAGD